MKKALLINVVEQTITEVGVGHYTDIYKHIGNDCSLFQVPIEFENLDSIYVDEEGLLKEVHGGFIMEGWSYPLIGNAVIQGSDDEGDSTDYKSDIEELRKKVVFITKEAAQAWQNTALGNKPQIIFF
jgi:hypothetical protein